MALIRHHVTCVRGAIHLLRPLRTLTLAAVAFPFALIVLADFLEGAFSMICATIELTIVLGLVREEENTSAMMEPVLPFAFIVRPLSTKSNMSISQYITVYHSISQVIAHGLV